MKLSEFDFELPKKLIAQKPKNQRDTSRMMVVSKSNKINDDSSSDNVNESDFEFSHKHFSDIVEYFEDGDVLVLNNTKVEPVKLVGRKISGAASTFIVSKKISDGIYDCQIATNKVRVGHEFVFGEDTEWETNAKVIEAYDRGEGVFKVEFDRHDIDLVLENIGEMPLPPYIQEKTNREKYQTVFAEHSGSIAAPTAGFHFTPELLRKIEEKGVIILKVTLHVGYGTFMPVKTETITDHKMHSEWIEITEDVAREINSRSGRLVVCGTTVMRTLESCADSDGKIKAFSGETDIFIYPGYEWKCRPDMMITNFHLPKSTLLMMISSLVGLENLKKAYEIAIGEKYRFYSFGDAMLLDMS